MNNMMVKEHEMKNEIYKYIADSVNCTVEQLKSGTTCFVKNPWEGCIKILSIRDTDIIPFYSASVTNLASQAVAIRSGYMPLWTDSYGVR